mmetsp:Transcript_11361/g.15466  ORF Transcript_11361/g.15466 Transcript_11361/m.15466 type:complete len:173 (-) Transcript_11361:213-731(-)
MTDFRKITKQHVYESEVHGNTQEKHWLSEGESEDSEAGLGDLTEHPDFYDSDADDQDEKWIQHRREGRNSDALLSCPCCFCTLTLDCQRHAQYTHQYRAMFVQNCVVDRAQQVRILQPGSGASIGCPSETSTGDKLTEDTYFPVKCETCKTEVGLFDHEEMYHFFNAFPSCS